MTSKQNRPASAKGKDISIFEEIEVDSNGGSNTQVSSIQSHQPPEPGSSGQAQDQRPRSPSFELVDAPSGAGARERLIGEIPEREAGEGEATGHEARGKERERNPESAQERAARKKYEQAQARYKQFMELPPHMLARALDFMDEALKVSAERARQMTGVNIEEELPADVREMLVNEDGELLELADLGFPETVPPAVTPPKAAKTEPEPKTQRSSILTDAPGGPDIFGRRSVAVHPQIVEMFKSGWHVPFTAMTTASLNALFEDSGALKATKKISRNGEAHRVLELSVFGEEGAMSSEDWQEAWRNFLAERHRIVGPSEGTRWKEHFDFLVEHEDFRTDFRSVLKFDIKLRREWFTADVNAKPTFTVGSDSYREAIRRIQFAAVRDAMHSKENRANSGQARDPSLTYSSTDRYRPYDKGYERSDRAQDQSNNGGPDRRGVRAHGGTNRPFSGGRSSASAGPLCLICAECGHTSNRCGRTTIAGSGRPTFASYGGNKLVAARSRIELCMGWNLGGILPCKSRRCPDNPGCHICSFCGAADHPASSRKCL